MAKKKSTSSKATSTSLESADATQLRSELVRRERSAKSIIAKRSRLLVKLAAMDERIRAMGIRPDGRLGKSPRAKNPMTLVEALQRVLKDKTLGIPEIVAALPSVGYVTHSLNLRGMVNAQLLKKSLFKRTGRGFYTAK